jgi:hypothetical protein
VAAEGNPQSWRTLHDETNFTAKEGGGGVDVAPRRHPADGRIFAAQA